MSPTARSLQHLRDLGYKAQVVEHTIAHTFIKKDLFGVDILGLKPAMPILAIQCTTGANHGARKKKLEASGFIPLWTQSGASLEIWSWKKAGPRGQRKVWQLKREMLI